MKKKKQNNWPFFTINNFKYRLSNNGEFISITKKLDERKFCVQ